MITENPLLLITIFGMVSSLVLLLAILLGKGRSPVEGRLADATRNDATAAGGATLSRSPRDALFKVGSIIMPSDDSKLTQLKTRLLKAGLYQRHTSAVYLGGKMLLLLCPMVAGLLLASLGLLGLNEGILFGAIVGVLGNLAPNIWLNRLKTSRQTRIRRALPDALDVIVVCLEGGLSAPASFARVASELRDAHPLLASELGIVQREIQLGRSTGEALRQLADRFDAEELRSLASVITQAERFGASIVTALRVHAEALRIKRYQDAETEAQKAPVKLIFPTVLCIFPALYIVLMGPAGVQLLEMLDNLS
jgi:tight adherence protein C